jgi:hypothetical protein
MRTPNRALEALMRLQRGAPRIETVTLFCHCGSAALAGVEVGPDETADDVAADLVLTCPDCQRREQSRTARRTTHDFTAH